MTNHSIAKEQVSQKLGNVSDRLSRCMRELDAAETQICECCDMADGVVPKYDMKKLDGLRNRCNFLSDIIDSLMFQVDWQSERIDAQTETNK